MLIHMKKNVIFLFILLVFSCGINKKLSYSSDYLIPTQEFNKYQVFVDLDYNNSKNWAFRSDFHDYKKLMPKNYKYTNENKYDVSVFYIHPTSLFSSEYWNADTTHFVNNQFIDLCLENQASVFAGLGELYAPHYREMHIYSYSDTVNGLKAFDVAYKDVLLAFKYFFNNLKTDKFIIVSHSQGTNHAKKLINEYIYNNVKILDKLVLSYLIGMDISKDEMLINLCEHPHQLNCYLSWRSFNHSYYPFDWKYGDNYISINPIDYTSSFLWTAKKLHKGILLPNKKIFFKKSLSVRNEKGLLWVKLPNNIFLNRFKRNSYHNADFNLFWVNMRSNFISRMENLE